VIDSKHVSDREPPPLFPPHARRAYGRPSASRTSPAPLYKIGDRVIFDGRASIVEDVKRASTGAYILTVSNYAGGWMIGETHSGLSAE